MVGRDSDERNQRKVEEAVIDATRIFRYSQSHLIEPPPAERLPEFRCIAELGANHPTRDLDLMCSYCVLIWFQDRQLLHPLNDLQKIADSLNWDDVSVDSIY